MQISGGIRSGRGRREGVFLMIRFATEFNCVSRCAVLSVVRTHFPVLALLGRYLLPLRSCSGWAKVLYSCRTVTLCLRADCDIRHSLHRLLGTTMSDSEWRLASLDVSAGGIGARSAPDHAATACFARVSQCEELRSLICLGYARFGP